MEKHLQIIRQKAVPILKKAGVTRSALFGSQVRGEAKEDSDIDILVTMPKGISLLDFIQVKLELEDTLGKKVDLVDYHSIRPKLKDQILSEEVRIL